MSFLIVGYSTVDHRNFYKVLLSGFNTFGNCSSNFTCLTKAVAYCTFSITYYYDSSKCKGTSTLRNFNYTIDSNQSIF